jgi:flagellar hook-associated protein 2
MGTTSSSLFTGSSAYSQDLQNVITRAVSIASLPINLLTADQTTLTAQANEWKTIDSKFSAVQTAVQDISQALDGASFQAGVSDDSVVSAAVSTGAVEGNYSIQVNDVGAYPTSISTSSWTVAQGAAHQYELWVGNDHYTFTPADNSAASVASAINATYGSLVRATVVNVGSSTAPDYRISLQGAKLADTPVDLKDGGVSLQSAQAQGKPAQYVVNNSGNVVQSDSRTVNIATGLNVTLLSSSDTPVDITVTRPTSALSDALSAFAAAYNAAVDELDLQRGQGGGSLQGQPSINQVSRTLSGIATYVASAGGVGGLADLGMDLGADGKITFNEFTLVAADLTNPSGVTSFFGSATGGGFLKAATDALNSLEDPTSGLIKTAQSDLSSQIAGLDQTIADKQAQVDDLQLRLENQMASADALISSMEQQYSYITSMFQAMQTADQQYK